MFFYLKINRNENYTYRNLRRWLDVAEFIHAEKVFILCDNEIIKEIAIKKIDNIGQAEWITSIKNNDEISDLINRTIVEKWKNAAYAHLTTFKHAMFYGVKEFWNIDADDTFICLSTERTAELLNTVSKKALNDGVNIFSLDMWRSRYVGLHWTFGITYVNGNIDWIHSIKSCIDNNSEAADRHMVLCRNVDSLFTFIGEMGVCKTGTYCFENLHLIHYSDDFFRRPFDSGMFIYSEGKIMFPVALYCLGLKEIGEIPIYTDVEIMDIGISDEESFDSLLQNGYNSNSPNWIHRMYELKKKNKTDQEIKEDVMGVAVH